MKRLILGLGLGTALAYGFRRLSAAPQPQQPSWEGTDNDPEDGVRVPETDDATLVDRVQSQVFRETDVPVGAVNVNAEFGRVILRGEVKSDDLIEDLVERTRQVEGVREVENLLHTPDAGAPTQS